jgi:hypothetical protein
MEDADPAAALIGQLEELAPRLGGRFVVDPEKVRAFNAAAARVQAQADAVVARTRPAAARGS